MTEQEKKRFKTVPAMDTEEYKEKLKTHRRKILKRTLLIAAVIFAVLAGIFLYLSLRHYEDYEVLSEAQRQDTAATVFKEFQGNILKYSNDGALYLDTGNERIWNQTYEMTDPTIDICENYLVIYDRKGTTLYILTPQGLVSKIETTMAIEQVSIAAQGTVAVLMGDAASSYVVLYDKNGKELVSGVIYGEDGGYPIAVALSHDAIKLAVSMLDISEGVVKTTIAFYNFGTIGENEIDRIVSANSYSDMVIPQMDFISNDKMVAYGDSAILLFEGTQRPKESKQIPLDAQAKTIFHNNKYIGVVSASLDETHLQHITVYDMHGFTVMEKDFSMEYTQIGFLGKNEVCMTDGRACDIYTVQGIYKFHYDFDVSLYHVISGTAGLNYTFVMEGTTQKIRLK